MTPHGDYAKELELYVDDAGVDARTVLWWATGNGAECMGMGEELGAIAEGRLADLIVVNGDPLSDIAVLSDPDNIRLVMKDGRVIKETSPAAPASRLRAAK